MVSYAELENKAEQYVNDFILKNYHPELTYHNIEHIHQVVGMVDILCKDSQYDERTTSLLRIAAWFHDIGYFSGKTEGHEKIGAEMATDFLKNNQVPEDDLKIVSESILATEMPQNPTTKEGKILCDADMSHISTPTFFDSSKKLRKEIEHTRNINIDKKAWIADTLLFMRKHQYFTSYANRNLVEGKQQNLHLLESKLKEYDKKESKSEKDKKEKPSKGIETMFRITSSNNQKLSAMADNKAHILISVNSIILSAIISLLLRKLTEYEYLSIPTYIILSVSVVSMIFSLVATRPNLPSGEFSKKDVEDKKVNLLFFGNFYKMSLEDYTKGMTTVMGDYEYLYHSLIKDVYSQGVVLSQKYKLLRISYTVFMFGMILSVISFIISSIIHILLK